MPRQRGLHPLAAVAIALVLGVAIGLGIRYLRARVARELITPAPSGQNTPDSAGVPYVELMIPSGDHVIAAWWVRAPGLDSTTPTVLLFHGNGGSLSDQVGVQQVLFRAGISSLAFDYAGFGKSSGSATPAALRDDARAAFGVFADSSRHAARRVLLGTSLGAAVLLDAVTDIQTGVDGVVLVGVFSSTREVAARARRVPHALAFLIPNPYDNLDAVRRLERPLLIVHSASDRVFPLDGAERLLEAASVPKRLVRLDRTRHDEYLSTNQDWVSVLDFIKRGLE